MTWYKGLYSLLGLKKPNSPAQNNSDERVGSLKRINSFDQANSFEHTSSTELVKIPETISPLQFLCKPSKIYKILLSVIAVLTLLFLLVVPIDSVLKLGLIICLLMLSWQRLAIEANLSSRYSVCGIRTFVEPGADTGFARGRRKQRHCQWQIKLSGRWHPATLESESVVTARAMVLQWRVSMGGKKAKRAYSVLLPDSAEADELRQLRVYLRFKPL